MSGCRTRWQCLESSYSNWIWEWDLRGTWGVCETERTCQCSLRRTWHHQRTDRRCARARCSLESWGHWAVAATVTPPCVPVQHSSCSHGSLNLGGMNWGGFGTNTWTARNNQTGWSSRDRWYSRGGITSDYWSRGVTCLLVQVGSRMAVSWLEVCRKPLLLSGVCLW